MKCKNISPARPALGAAAITALAALLALPAIARPAPAQDVLTVAENKYAIKGDSVYVDLEIGLNNAKVRRRAFVLLTPVIKQGSVSIELPAAMINGRNRQKAYRRLVAMEREPVGPGMVIDAAKKRAPRTYLYSAAVPYEPWMKEGTLSIRQEQCECGGPLVKICVEKLAGPVQDLNPPPAPSYRDVQLNFTASFKVPNPEPVKMRSESGKAYLAFDAGRSELRGDLKNNAAELSKIGDMIGTAKSDPAITITKIIIDGYASPEDSYATNMALSARRAAALKGYIRIAYNLPESLFNVRGMGEDWKGFEGLVAASAAPYREQALAIIRSSDLPDAREKELKALQGGGPWKDMFEEFFPKLRRTDYELQYTVAPFSVEEGKKILETNPSLLSLNEMYLIAQSYPAGSAQFQRVFDIAARTYPGSDIANFNAAANALAGGDSAAAAKYLEKVKSRDAAFENNLGVLAALRGDYDKAAGHFAQAAKGGNAEAAKNMAEIEKLKE